MNTSAPWLSVILCTYQGERFLPATLDSIAAQDRLDDVEIIAIDDGSSDATPQILEAASTTLPIRMLPTERTGNWVINTNKGLREACGTYCCLLHQDDLWAADRLAVWRRLTQAHAEAGFFISSALYIDDTGRRIGRWTPPLPTHTPVLTSATVLQRLLVQNNFALPAPLFKRAILPEGDAMDSSLWFLADWKLWGTLVARSPVVYHPQPLVSFRLHGASQTTTRTRRAAQLRSQYLDVIESILASLDRQAPEAKRAHQAAHINMAVSIALAGMTHGERYHLRALFADLPSASPRAWLYFMQHSRITQRIVARLRAGLHQPRKGAA